LDSAATIGKHAESEIRAAMSGLFIILEFCVLLILYRWGETLSSRDFHWRSQITLNSEF
jgi:hypothetical protein